MQDFWFFTAFILFLSGGAVCALAAGWIFTRGDRDRPDRLASAVALALTSLWCVIGAALGADSETARVAEIARNLGWLFALYRLFANDGRHETLRPIRPVISVLVCVEISQLALMVVIARFSATDQIVTLTLQLSAMFRVLVAVGALVLLHNLYVGAVKGIRPVLRWSAAALAALWAFELNLFTVTYLSGAMPAELTAIRGLVMASIAIPLAIGAKRSAASIRIRPSRSVTFQSLSLLIIAAYLLLMVAIAQSLAMIDGGFGRLTQVVFTFVATVVALLWLPSQRLRGWVRVTAVKHLFQHRYDYRSEWLRFTQTISKGDGSESSLKERVIQVMADITDSPKGLLLLPGDTGSLELAARWSWREAEVPPDPIPTALAELFETQKFILDVDDVCAGKDQHGELALLPEWLSKEADAWALVPLLHFDRLTGVIVLSRPAVPRRLDWEDFDLLRLVGQQSASYLAEQSGHQALMESARFDEFNRRIAFVMHDVKNLASQLSLLATNAEKHAENPDFRKDMLVTLKNSANKLNSLLARLNRYGANGTNKREPVDLVEISKRVVEHYKSVHPVSLIRSEASEVIADAEGVEQSLVHLVQNAIDASEAESPVYIDVTSDGVRGLLEVIDSGSGMSTEFIRDGLFKPFVSSKNAGFGIGAFEAREMIKAMGGRLDVESREELGSRFAMSFPLSAIAGYLSEHQDLQNAEVA